MKTRIITALVCIPLMILVFLFVPMWGVGIVVGVICAGAALELLRCVFAHAPKRVYASSMIVAFLLPFLYSLGYEGGMGFSFTLFFLMSCELMASYLGKKKVSFEMVAVSILAGALMPMMFGTLVRLGRIETIGRPLMFLPFIAAFSSDIGAYFVGRFLGKHKLAPQLSPKKTVEGAVGGLVIGALLTLAYGSYLRYLGFQGSSAAILIYGVMCAGISQLGDLTFSAIKRQYGIKDYGKIFPGHGGFLDRFDSLYYVIPLTQLWMDLMPVIVA